MHKYTLSLDGLWELSGWSTPDFAGKEFTVSANVPGNIELDLYNAGIVEDPYICANARQLMKYEDYSWEYKRTFEYSGGKIPCDLVMEGVDCLAEIFINGKKAGETANAFIVHRLKVEDLLVDGTNTIAIKIASTRRAIDNKPFSSGEFVAFPYNYESMYFRKPAHSWGWDITPRMALGGIWRSIRLEGRSIFDFETAFLQLCRLNPDGSANMIFHYQLREGARAGENITVKVSGVCGESKWSTAEKIWNGRGAIRFVIADPVLWWPRNYGSSALYNVVCEVLKDDVCVSRKTFNAGIRTVTLKNKGIATTEPDPDFQFIVNGVPVRVNGTCHVPADSLHSRDTERLPEIQKMFTDLNCNMIRIWGGGVYEADSFYDFCDREGIMIWHDFMFACGNYPADEELLQAVKEEAVSAVRRLRQHPSIALWCGDNECDLCLNGWGAPQDPAFNKITREVLPAVCNAEDPSREYLASSPFLSPALREKTAAGHDPEQLLPENHLWGPRDYFKSNFYRNSRASFASEIGYHGCPNVSSIKRFISPDKVWPWQNNEEWNYHASNPFSPDSDVTDYRTTLMAEQIMEMFGVIPDNIEDFAAASQICQAEAKKYFVELFRSNPKKSGILWWNLVDCWPQFSDAVVDSYFSKKLAYHYIKRVQQPFAIIMPEAAAWYQTAVAVNDTRETREGSFRIWDCETDKEFASGKFSVAPNSICRIANVKVCTTAKKLLLIQWQLRDGTTGVNHALCGYPQFDFELYSKKYLPAIAKLDNSFDAEKVGK